MVSLVAPEQFHPMWETQGPPTLWLHPKEKALPASSVLMREDGMVRFGDGIHITMERGELTVTNRSGVTLAAIVLRGADGRVVFFDSLSDREQVTQSQGRSVRVLRAPAAAKYYPLLLDSLERHMEGVVPGSSRAWASVEALRSGDVDWWPADVPVLIACVVGGSNSLVDTGRPLVSDRSLVRVVGYGGRP